MKISRRALFRQMTATGVAAVSAPAWAAGPAAGLQAAEPRPSTGLIRLDRNTNPYGPSPMAADALRKAAARAANGDATAAIEALRTRLAELHGVIPARVVVGSGSAELLRLAVQTCAAPRKNVVAAVPTRGLIEQVAERAGVELAAVPLDDRFAHDLSAMLARQDGSTGLVYICNPNNPTGTLTTRDAIEEFLRRLPSPVHVVIDEAYHHYVQASNYTSFLDRPVHDPRVIVLRSFSKIFGLAGLRISYAIAAADTARSLQATQLNDNVSAVGAVTALAALDDVEHLRTCARRNTDDRQEFLNEASARMLRTIDSHTNFVMLDTGRPASQVMEHFKTNGIAIAGFFPYFAKYIRVSLGTASEMGEFWRVWDLMPRLTKMSM